MPPGAINPRMVSGDDVLNSTRFIKNGGRPRGCTSQSNEMHW